MTVCCSTSKKSAERTWASRSAFPVSIDDRTMLASTDDSNGFSPVTKVPENSLKRPLTLLTMRWRMLNPTSEWVWSMDQVPGM